MTVEEAEHEIREVVPQILDELPDEVRSITQNLCVRVLKDYLIRPTCRMR